MVILRSCNLPPPLVCSLSLRLRKARDRLLNCKEFACLGEAGLATCLVWRLASVNAGCSLHPWPSALGDLGNCSTAPFLQPGRRAPRLMRPASHLGIYEAHGPRLAQGKIASSTSVAGRTKRLNREENSIPPRPAALGGGLEYAVRPRYSLGRVFKADGPGLLLNLLSAAKVLRSPPSIFNGRQNTFFCRHGYLGALQFVLLKRGGN